MMRRKRVAVSLGFIVIVLSIPITWYALAADSRLNEITPPSRQFQFARMRYPGGIPDFVKNWYTDYPNMDSHLTTLRGGLWFADDFHGDEEFDQFLQQLRRVIPDAKPVELTTSHPLFHCFYDIDEIIQVTNDSIAKCAECEQWENGPSGRIPKVFAIFDQRGRIIVLMAWNTDLGDGLEWADDPEYPAEYSAYAFRFVSNVVVYAMSH
jgi:hypothetical protein